MWAWHDMRMQWLAPMTSKRPAPAVPEYEFWHLRLPSTTSRGAARRLLTDRAEYGHWELARVRLDSDGTRRITLRRKILRVRPTI